MMIVEHSRLDCIKQARTEWVGGGGGGAHLYVCVCGGRGVEGVRTCLCMRAADCFTNEQRVTLSLHVVRAPFEVRLILQVTADDCTSSLQIYGK